MAVSSECVFCRIVKGSIPAVRVYEDESILAFMDIAPLVKGHTLVIPKAHHMGMGDISPALLQELVVIMRMVAKAQKDGLKADGVNVFLADGRVAGQEIDHIHFHVIPRFAGDGYSFNWRPGRYANREEMEQLAVRMKEALKSETPLSEPK
ncbi:MAG: HIT family protein [Kiritimatiellae bacterium]|nr:HIT family protein [Kiritimatiellia bacterium]